MVKFNGVGPRVVRVTGLGIGGPGVEESRGGDLEDGGSRVEDLRVEV